MVDFVVIHKGSKATLGTCESTSSCQGWRLYHEKMEALSQKKGGFMTKNKIQLYMKRSYASSRA